ncbi:hypothetical protein [Microcystis phage Mel-JY33]
MTYWHVLIITILSGDLEGAKVLIPYPTEESCIMAIPGVSETLPYDHSLRCWKSDEPSGSVRPKARP